MTSSLLTATLALLDQTGPEDWKRIAKECDVSIAWLRLLCEDRVKEPGVNKVERVYTALSGKTLEL